MTVGIVFPGSGNITSLCDCMDRLGKPHRVLAEPDFNGIKQLILPGQGRFGTVMSYLEKNCWRKPLQEWVDSGKTLIGICVGMQVLFESSEEDPGVSGLGFLKGKVGVLEARKRPMMGWAEVVWSKDFFANGAAYFVNGYVVKQSEDALAKTDNEGFFVSAVQRENLLGFQFHPEKSGFWGKELLATCLDS